MSKQDNDKTTSDLAVEANRLVRYSTRIEGNGYGKYVDFVRWDKGSLVFYKDAKKIIDELEEKLHKLQPSNVEMDNGE